MADNRIEINLGFRADVTEAKKNIQDLQNSLIQISNLKANPGTQLNTSLQEAAKSADILQQHLTAAMDVKTGNLNLNKFQASLKQSGQDVSKLAGSLLNAGITGEQAFTQLQNSIAMANIRITQSNGLLSRFATTLKNTAKWQISSTILHGFMSAIQGAYGYAQDLNESLNKIRIVTGQSVDQMDKFAAKANKAAQELSASTLAYTDAALIFYQQGLDDKSVEERTDVTVKMMNVTKQSAEEVSSQMTAIWNNFDDGSKSMEHYADVITNLGAKTASSSSEIAEGLQKFSAVANTVGLSYEYATTALATVVAQTRQSADTVGTAFKTLFARIQDLELGKDLDDGTTLGKYSKALATVGVNIKDVNGEVKEMDQILDELGSKWGSLSKDVQEATAQTVAGTRQYANFLALMDNWDVFQNNLSIAENSDGTLEEQAKIYEESWEASSKRVKASLQELYSNIIDDKFFISLNDNLAKIVQVIGSLLKGMGGVKGLLLVISNVIISKLGPTLTTGIDNALLSLNNFKSHIHGIGGALSKLSGYKSIETLTQNFKNGTTEAQKMQASMLAEAKAANIVTDSFREQTIGMEKINILTNAYQQNYFKMTQAQREIIQNQLEQLVNANNLKAAALDELEIIRSKASAEKDFAVMDMQYTATREDGKETQIFTAENKENAEYIKKLIDDINTRLGETKTIADPHTKSVTVITSSLDSMNTLMGQMLQDIYDANVSTEVFSEMIDNITQTTDKEGKETAEWKQSLLSIVDATEGIDDSTKDYMNHLITTSSSVSNLQNKFKEIRKETLTVGKAAKIPTDQLEKQVIAGTKAGKAILKYNQYTNQFNKSLSNSTMSLKKIANQAVSVGGSIQKGLSAFTSVAMAINGVSNMIRTLKDDSASLGDKISAVAMGATQGFGGLMSVLRLVTDGMNGVNVATALSRQLTDAAAAAKEKDALVTKLQGMATKEAQLAEIQKQVTEKTGITGLRAKIAAKKIYKKLEIENQAATKAGDAVEKASIATDGAKTAAIETQTVAEGAETAQKESSIPIDYQKEASGWAALGPALLFVAIAAAIIAAIAGIIALIVNLVNAESDEEKAAREANEQLQAQQEHLKAAQEHADGLREAIEKYKDAVKILKDCTKGTQEWNEAFQNVLNTAYDLVEAYPELLKYENLYNNDGTINEDVLEQAQKAADMQVAAAKNATLQAQTKKMEADNNLAKSNISDDVSDHSKAQYYTDGTYRGQNYTDTDSQKAISAILNSSSIDLRNADAKEITEFLKTVFNESDFIGDFDTAIQGITNGIIESKDSIIELGNNTQATAQAMVNAQKLITSQMFSEEIAENPDDAFAYSAAIAEERDAIAKEMADAYDYMDYDNSNNSGNDDNEDEMKKTEGGKLAVDAFYAYAQSEGVDAKLIDDDAIVDEGGARYYNAKTANGEDYKVRADIVLDWYKENLLAQRKNKIANAAKDKKDFFEGKSDATKDYATDRDFGRVNYNELQNMYDENGNFNIGMTDDEIKQVLMSQGLINSETTEEEIEEMIKKYKNDAEKMADQAKKVYDEIPSYITDVMDDSLGEGHKIDSGQVSSVTEMYQTALANAGKAGTEILNNIANSAGDEAGLVIGALSEMENLSSASVNDINKKFEEMGISFKVTGENVAALHNLFRDSSKFTLEAAETSYKETKKVIDKLKDTGSTLEDEDYNKLLELIPDAEKYFTTMADGTHMLIGDAEEFKRKVQEQQLAQYAQAANNQKEMQGIYNQFANNEVQSFSATDIGNVASSYRNNTAGVGDPTAVLNTKYLDSAQAMIKVLEDSGKFTTEVVEWQSEIEAAGRLSEESLKAIADGYDTLGIKTEDYGEKAKEANEKAAKAQEAMKMAEYQNAVENAGLNLADVEAYAQSLLKADNAQVKNIDDARKLAVANSRLDKGVSNLNDNLDTYKKALTKANKGTADYAKQMKNLKTDLGDIFNMDGSSLSDSFAEATLNSKDLKKALDGDEKAILRLQEAAADDIIANIKTNIVDAEGNPDTNAIAKFEADWNYLKENMAEGLKAGNVDQTDLINSFNDLIEKGHMTREQIESAMAGLHVSADIATDYHNQDVVVTPEYTDTATYVTGQTHVEWVGTDGIPRSSTVDNYRTKKTVSQGPPETITSWVPTYSIKGKTGSDGKSTVAFTKTPPPKVSKSSTTSGKASGGGSKKDKKKSSDEIERYHQVNKRLESQNRILEKLSNAKDQAWGADRLAIMDQESAELKKQIALQSQLVGETEAYLKQDRKALEAYGATFDEFGNISNYDQIMKQQLDKFNASLSDEAEEAYNTFKEILERYEETVDANRDATEELEQLQRDFYAHELEKIDYAINFKIEVHDQVLDQLNRKIDKLGDSAANAAEKLALIGQTMDENGKKIEDYEEGIHSVLTNALYRTGATEEEAEAFVGRFKNGEVSADELYSLGLTEDELEHLKEYTQGMQEAGEDIEAAMQSVADVIDATFEDIANSFDKQMAKVERAGAVMEHYQSIVDVLGEKMLGLDDEFMDQVRETNLQVTKTKLTVDQDRIETYQANLADAQRLLQQAIEDGNEEMVERYQNTVDTIQENLDGATDDLYAHAVEGLELIKEQFAQTTERIVKDMQKSFTGGEEWDVFKEKYEYAKEAAERYIPEYKKIYELNKLNRDVLKSIDETDSVKGKQLLLDLQEKINKAQAEGIELSEYDLANMRREYELKLAQNALEEAKNAKDTVRMTKNAEGGWSYVYTANENDVAKAEQNYEDKVYAMQEANEKYIQQLQDNIISAQEECTQRIQELDVTAYTSQEEYYAAVQNIVDEYKETFEYNSSQLQNAMSNNEQLQAKDLTWYQDEYLAGKQKSDENYYSEVMPKLITDFGKTLIGGLTGTTSLTEYHKQAVEAIGNKDDKNSYLGQLYTAYDKFSTDTDDILSAVGTSVDGFASDWKEDMVGTDGKGGIKKDLEDVKKETEKLKDESKTNFTKAANAAADLETAWKNKFQLMINKTEELVKLIIKLQQKAAKEIVIKVKHIDEYEQKGNPPATNYDKTSSSDNGNDTSSSSTSGTADIVNGYKGVTWDGKEIRNSRKSKVEQTIRASFSERFILDHLKKYMSEVNARANMEDQGLIGTALQDKLQKRLSEITTYASGGYTGDWKNNSGKLAILHEKELVLNKADTENILQSVDIVRRLADKLISLSQYNQYNRSLELVAENLMNGILNNEQTVNQDIIINAEFPNVEDHNEIKIALEQLANEASQYAYRSNLEYTEIKK